MKATKLLVGAALLTGLTSLSFAGPGIEYWNRVTEAAKSRTSVEAKAKTDAPITVTTKAKPAPQVAVTCATCECCAKKA